jgi:hypothetical protein
VGPGHGRTPHTAGSDHLRSGQPVGSAFPANSTVKFTNTTGLIEVTISASLAATLNGAIGAGFFIDGNPATVVNGGPANGVQFRDATNTAGGSGTGMSYTVAIPIRKGFHSASIFYTANNPGSATSQILSASLLVKSL